MRKINQILCKFYQFILFSLSKYIDKHSVSVVNALHLNKNITNQSKQRILEEKESFGVLSANIVTVLSLFGLPPFKHWQLFENITPQRCFFHNASERQKRGRIDV